MGQSASYTAKAKKEQDEQQTAPTAKGHWVSDIKTGFRWATDPLVSGPEVVKKPLGNTVPGFENNNNLKMITSVPNLPGEVWGPYDKKFTKSDISNGQVFTPPESIDGIPILCRCRDIPEFMRDERGGRMLQGLGAVTLGKNIPACWDDIQSLWNPLGGMKFYVMTRHPEFYAYAASKDGIFGVAKSIATGPVSALPLAVGAYYMMRPTAPAAAVAPAVPAVVAPTAPAAAPAAAVPAIGGTRRARSRNAKRTRKMNRLKSRRHR